MNIDRLKRMVAGIEPWKDSFGQGQETRGFDGQSWYDLSINCNSIPCQTEIAIIVTSWQGQLKWLKPVLTQYRLADAFVILAYDNPFYAFSGKSSIEMIRSMPNPEHYLLSNSVVHKHITYDADKRNGWFWDVRYAQGVIRSFPNIKYVYVTNGDCICENPKGFKEVIKLLGEDELIAGQHTSNDIIHTATMFFKVDAFHKIFDAMYDVMRIPIIGAHSPEMMVVDAVRKLNIKVKKAPKQPLDANDGTVDCYSRYDQDSTWKDLLGFKNLFAIQETLGNEGKEPIDKKYTDDYEDFIYFNGEEKETICQFYKTGDRRYLYMWLDRWEDSDYNRLYTPLNFYSESPVYSREEDIKLFRKIKTLGES